MKPLTVVTIVVVVLVVLALLAVVVGLNWVAGITGALD